ncbi:MAG: hydroxyacylglutathione hydrolase [Alphaproteobacteria bacterium]|nr:hydroxyacylglutathione hydrolase [Alphaproteobacteria bacterium]
MSQLEFSLFPCLKDNYGCLVHDPESGQTVSIDAPEAAPVFTALNTTGAKLSHIFVTHHHGDHTAGIGELKAATGCRVVGPTAEAQRIDGLDHTVAEGDALEFGGKRVEVLDTPGHTLGHISYWFKDADTAFVGDTLFALGCGRVFEGTNTVMWKSLHKLMQLPAQTKIYCGHEYTAANAAFALTIEPENQALCERAKEILKLRSDGVATIPTTMALELATNPFLRPHSEAIRARLKLQRASDADVFSEIRERKNKA